MKRRSFVASTAAALSLAGCLEDGEVEDDGNDDEESPGDDETENGEETVSVAGTEFEILERDGGTRGDEVNVEFDNDALTVTVEGELVGNNSCYTARLESADYDADDGSLNIDVVAFDDSGDDIFCNPVVTEIEYRLVVTFEGRLPGTARLRHDGETVAEASRN